MGKLLYGVGLNDAESVVDCPYYKRWSQMLKRCYCKSYQNQNPRYVGVVVCNDWLTFSNFKAWMEKQDWQGKELDKDLLSGLRKLYSPSTCCFIPKRVNKFMTHGQNESGGFDGVSLNKGKFEARFSVEGKSQYLGRFDTHQEAYRVVMFERFSVAKRLASDLSPELGLALIAKYQNLYNKSRDKDIDNINRSLILT